MEIGPKLLILRSNRRKNKNASDGIGGAILYKNKHSTYLKIVKGKIGQFSIS